MAGEDPAGQQGHLVLVGQEALARVDDALVVVADLERDDRAHVQRDSLLGHAGLRDLRLAHGQRQVANLAEERGHEGAVAGDDPEGCARPTRLAPGDQHCLIGRWHVVTEHLVS